MKYKDIPIIRQELLEQQNFLCKICNQPLSPENSTLDHDHKTGYCRAVIHRSCNSLLGSIERGMKRFGITKEQLIGIGQNIGMYLEIQTEHIHPVHISKQNKKLKRKSSQKKPVKKISKDEK